MELRSTAFNDHSFMPDRCARDGGNVSPRLEWSPPPEGTAELELLCEDPDTPRGTFTHWVVTGIPPSVTDTEQGLRPPGSREGRNDFGEIGWDGPRPPAGDAPHRYVFRLIAVDRPLDLDAGASAADVRSAIQGHELDRGTLVGRFAR